MQALSGHTKIPSWLWLTALGFVVANAILIAFEVFYLPVLPVFLLLILVAFVRLDLLLLVTVFLTPLSILLSNLVEGIGVDLYLPTEPMLALMLLVYVLRFLKGHRADMRILRHPVTLAIYFHLA